MKRVLLLTFGLLVINFQPAQAKLVEPRWLDLLTANGVTHYETITFMTRPNQGVKPTDMIIHWTPQATDTEKSTEASLENSFDWLDINRDLKGFVIAVRTEPTFNAQIRNNLGKIFGLVAADYENNQLAQQDWSDAVANPDNAIWLTQAVQDKVIQFATTYKIPITAAIK